MTDKKSPTVREVSDSDRKHFLASVGAMKQIVLDDFAASEVEMLGIGAYWPLTGFMTSDDYRSVLEKMRLQSGEVFPLPVTLRVSREEARGLKAGEPAALLVPDGTPVAELRVAEVYEASKEREAELAYGTTEEAHPGVARLYAQGEVLVGGEVLLMQPVPHDDFPEHRLTPLQARALFAERGWKTVVGFQTRNPIHRAHEYLQKCALEMVDGLFIHPIVGETKGDDVPAAVRMSCYLKLIENYFPQERVILGVNPASMRYAGPREAVLHALVRRNYGCTHFIVGRDHAGVGNYYGTFDAHRIFDSFSVEELGITPIFFDHAFYCTRCGNMATAKTCPHPAGDRVFLSGTKVREMLQQGSPLPPEFTRLEISEILSRAYRSSAAKEVGASS